MPTCSALSAANLGASFQPVHREIYFSTALAPCEGSEKAEDNISPNLSIVAGCGKSVNSLVVEQLFSFRNQSLLAINCYKTEPITITKPHLLCLAVG